MPIIVGDGNAPVFTTDGSFAKTLGKFSASLSGSSENAPANYDGLLSRTLGSFQARFRSYGAGFPRIGAGRVGSRSWGDNPFQTGSNFDKLQVEVDNLAKCHFVVINGQPGGGAGYHEAIQDAINSIKAINPDCKIYQYVIFQEVGQSFSGDLHDMLVGEFGISGQYINPSSPVPQNCWYARDSGGNLEVVFGPEIGGNVAANLTTYVQPNQDLGEDRYFGELYIDEVFPTNFINPFDPPLDGFFIDVFDHRPREDVLDYNGDGVADNAKAGWNDGATGEAVASAYRDGQRRGAKRIKDTYPNMLVIGNCTTWPQESSATNPKLVLNNLGLPDVYPEYDGLLHGAWMETQIGAVNPNFAGFAGMQADGTLHSFGSPRMAMNNYLYLMRNTIEPRHVLNQAEMEVTSFTRSPTAGVNCTETAMFVPRFMMAMTAMDDGYPYIGVVTSTDASRNYNYTTLFDEMGVTGSDPALTREWLGTPLEDPLRDKEWAAEGEVPWITESSIDVYKREFENGFVIWTGSKPGGSTGATISGNANIPISDAATDFSGGSIPGNVFREIVGDQSSVNQGRTLNEATFPSGYSIRRMDGRFFFRE